MFAAEDAEGEGVGNMGASTEPTRHKPGASWSVSFSWGGGLQHWTDLREMQVYRFMSNIIKQVLSANGEGQDREEGAPGPPWSGLKGQDWLPPPACCCPSPKPASRREWGPLGALVSAFTSGLPPLPNQSLHFWARLAVLPGLPGLGC